jgi:hypothetical protein
MSAAAPVNEPIAEPHRDVIDELGDLEALELPVSAVLRYERLRNGPLPSTTSMPSTLISRDGDADSSLPLAPRGFQTVNRGAGSDASLRGRAGIRACPWQASGRTLAVHSARCPNGVWPARFGKQEHEDNTRGV